MSNSCKISMSDRVLYLRPLLASPSDQIVSCIDTAENRSSKASVMVPQFATVCPKCGLYCVGLGPTEIASESRRNSMRQFRVAFVLAAGIVMAAGSIGLA